MGIHQYIPVYMGQDIPVYMGQDMPVYMGQDMLVYMGIHQYKAVYKGILVYTGISVANPEFQKGRFHSNMDA